MRGPRFPINTPVRVKQAREYLGLGASGMAVALRLGPGARSTVYRLESGAQDIPGPTQLAYEHLVSERRAEERKGKRCRACGGVG